MGTASSCAETTVSDKLLATAFAVSSHIATFVAIRHPLRGDVSVQLPVPQAPLVAKPGATPDSRYQPCSPYSNCSSCIHR